MSDQQTSFKLLCAGGLNSNENHLELAEQSPGAAIRLINYEPSPFGGYRRIDGYQEYDSNHPYVGDETAEGKVLGVVYYKDDFSRNEYVIAARKDAGADTYSFWKHIPVSGWQKMDPGFPLDITDGIRTVERVRHVQFDFGAGNAVAFVDGVNPATVFDGESWYQIAVGGAGTDADPGGDQAIAAPSVVEVFKNHLFLSGDQASRALVCHSAPRNALDFTAANGGGQLPTGTEVVQIKPFRDNLFVFGLDTIQKIKPDPSAGFLQEPVTANVGCIARDSVVEIAGDLVFLAPDGLRPVAGTSRIGDVELETISRPIRGLLLDVIRNEDLDKLNAVVIRGKSQLRLFTSGDNSGIADSSGIVGGLTNRGGNITWEFGELLGIRASCCTSVFVGREEYVLHGDYDGRVFRQEVGTSLDGRDILSVYSTPYLDFGDTEIRKTLHKMNFFVRAEGAFEMDLSLTYDWGDNDILEPASYEIDSAGSPTVYRGRGVTYGGENVVYGGVSKPVLDVPVQGSGRSVQATMVTLGKSKPHSIQGIVYEFHPDGRR